jgi:LppP/LprE lipoprotein
VLAVPTTAAQEAASGGWLDRALTNWNAAGGTMPSAPAADEPVAAIISRCRLAPPRSTAAERAVDAAGWIPFWNVDQQLVRDDVEIVGGMRAADGMCRPESYNLFVFVGGRFAGTLSPVLMASRLDGSSGVVRMAPPKIATEFARYGPTDPLCCPSSRVTVNYVIDRSAAGPIVAPVEVRTTRP